MTRKKIDVPVVTGSGSTVTRQQLEANRTMADPLLRAIELCWRDGKLPKDIADMFQAKKLSREDAYQWLRKQALASKEEGQARFDAQIEKLQRPRRP